MKKLQITVTEDRETAASILRHIRSLRRRWNMTDHSPLAVLRHASGYAQGCADENADDEAVYDSYSNIAYQLERAAGLRKPLSWTTTAQV